MRHASELHPKQMRRHFCAARPSIQHRSSGNSAAAAPAFTLLSATQQWPTSKHDAASPSSCLVSPMLHTSELHPKQMRRHFCAARPSIQHRSSGNSAAAAPAFTLLSATQQWPTSKHDAASPSSCLVSPMLHASKLHAKQIRHHFWAQRAPIQHRSSGNSAAAASAPTLLSATQHLPASKHDAAT